MRHRDRRRQPYDMTHIDMAGNCKLVMVPVNMPFQLFSVFLLVNDLYEQVWFHIGVITEESIINLQKIIDSKASLLRKALGTDDLSVQISEDRIAFSWFHIEDPANTSAYAHLVSALCQMAQKAKRVTAKEKPVESEKYAMRIWLQRLGFGGSEFKEERALLLKNLSGTSAFKNQAEAEAFNEKLKAKRANKAESGVAI